MLLCRVGAAPLLLLLLLLLELPLELLLHPSGLWPRCGCDGVKQRARVSERWGGSGHRARSGGAGNKRADGGPRTPNGGLRREAGVSGGGRREQRDACQCRSLHHRAIRGERAVGCNRMIRFRAPRSRSSASS